MWRAKTMVVSEDFPDEYLSHESSNGNLFLHMEAKLKSIVQSLFLHTTSVTSLNISTKIEALIFDDLG
jgi:hypothetical protein